MYYNCNPYMQQSNQFQQPIGIKGRPVSSLEEVRAAQIDFDGSLFVFPDIANRRIYTKQINLDGTASLNVYELVTLPQKKEEEEEYVTRAEFQSLVDQLKAQLGQGQTETVPAQSDKKVSFNF